MWGALIGGAVSLFSGSKARKQAKADAAEQARIQAGRENIATQQESMSSDMRTRGDEQYDQYNRDFAPINQAIARDAMEDDKTDFTAIARDNSNAFDSSEDQQRRALQRRGVSSYDGMSQEATRKNKQGKALSLVGNMNKGRAETERLNFDKKLGASRIGSGIMSNANTLYSNSGSLLAGAGSTLNGVSSTQMQQTGRNANDSAAWGETLGNIAGGFDWDNMFSSGSSSTSAGSTSVNTDAMSDDVLFGGG